MGLTDKGKGDGQTHRSAAGRRARQSCPDSLVFVVLHLTPSVFPRTAGQGSRGRMSDSVQGGGDQIAAAKLSRGDTSCRVCAGHSRITHVTPNSKIANDHQKGVLPITKCLREGERWMHIACCLCVHHIFSVLVHRLTRPRHLTTPCAGSGDKGLKGRKKRDERHAADGGVNVTGDRRRRTPDRLPLRHCRQQEEGLEVTAWACACPEANRERA